MFTYLSLDPEKYYLSYYEFLNLHILIFCYSAVLGGGSKDDVISFVSWKTSVLIFKEVLRRLMTFVMDSAFSWVQDLYSFIFNQRSHSEWSMGSSDNVLEKTRFALDILSSSLFCLDTIEAESELVQDILAAIFIIDWEFSWVNVSEGKFDEEQIEKTETRLSFYEAVHAFRPNLCDQLLKGPGVGIRKSLPTTLIRSIKYIMLIDSKYYSDNFISSCCQWALDIFEFFCQDQVEEQQLLEQFLSQNESWPLWVVPDKIGARLRTDDVPIHVSCVVLCFSFSLYQNCVLTYLIYLSQSIYYCLNLQLFIQNIRDIARYRSVVDALNLS